MKKGSESFKDLKRGESIKDDPYFIVLKRVKKGENDS